MAEELAALGIKIETDGIERGIQSLETLSQTGPKVEASMKKVEASSASTGKSLAGLVAESNRISAAVIAQSGAIEKGAQSLDKVGVSANQTAAALRGVPAQFTDIVTSLQGGQNPLTVLLQQGGQLKDMFGGIGPAARALGGYVAGLANPFTIAAAAAGVLAFAYNKGAQEAQAYSRAIILSGNAAGVTASGLQDMAASISAVVGTQSAAAAALATVAQSGVVGAANLESFTKAAIRMEAATGQAVDDTVKSFQELAKSPLEATLKLNEKYNYLTISVYDQIRALTEQGKATEAANVAQKAFADTIDQRASGIVGNLGYIETAWNKITGAIKGAGSAIAGVGRDTTLGENIKQAEENLARRQELNASLGIKDGLATQQAQAALAALKATQAGNEANAQAVRDSTEATKRYGIAVDSVSKVNASSLSKQEQLTKALRDYRKGLDEIRASNPNSALLNPASIAKSEAALRESFKDKTQSVKAEQNAYTELIASIKGKIEVDRLELALGVNATESQKIRTKLDQDLAAGKIKLSEAHKLSTKALLDELAALEKQQKAYDEALKSATARQDLRAKEAAGINDYLVAQQEAAAKSLGSVKERVQSLVDEQSAVDLSIARNISLAEAIERVAIARMEEKQAGFYQDSEGYAALQKEIDARNELARLAGSKAKREAATEANKQITQDWERTVNQIDDTFRTGFADMVNNGTSSWKSFTKSLATTFKTTVADAIYKTFAQKFVVNMVANVLGVTGLSGAANAVAGTAGGSSSLLGMANNASSAYSAAGFLAPAVGAFSSGAALSAAGLGAEAFSAGLTMMGSSTGVSSFMAGAGQALGAIGPVGWAALAAVAVASIFGGRKGGDKVGSFEGMGVGELATNSSSAQALTITTSIEAGFKNTAAILGDTASTLQSGVAFALDPQGDAQTQLQVVGTLNGQQVYNRSDRLGGIENVDRGEEALTKAIADETTRAVYAGLQASSIAQQMKDYLAGVDIGADPKLLTQRLNEVMQVKALAVAYEGLNNNLSKVFDSSTSASQALLAAVGGLESFNNKFGAYYNNFYSDQERSALTIKNVSASLATLGYTLPATREGFRALVDAQDLTTESGRTTYAALLGLSDAFASVTDSAASAADAAKAAAEALAATSDSAYATLERSIQAQRTAVQAAEAAAQESVTSLTGIFDLLQSSTKELYATVEANQVQAASTANRFIAQALSTAQKTGYLPDETVLSDAITAARTGLDSSNFTTAIEQQRATLVLAGQLQSLQDITGVQKSFAEQQLDVATAQVENLDALLKASKDQLDTLRGIDTSVLTVAAALSLFSSAIVAEGGTGMTPAEALAGILTNAGATVSATTVQAALLPIQGEQASAQLFTEFVSGMAKLQTAMEQAVLNTSQTNRTIDRLAVGGDALQVRVIA